MFPMLPPKMSSEEVGRGLNFLFFGWAQSSKVCLALLRMVNVYMLVYSSIILKGFGF